MEELEPSSPDIDSLFDISEETYEANTRQSLTNSDSFAPQLVSVDDNLQYVEQYYHRLSMSPGCSTVPQSSSTALLSFLASLPDKEQLTTDTDDVSHKAFNERAKRKRSSPVSGVIRLLKSFELTGWLAHLLYLNSLADDPFIQGLIFSLYSCGPLFIDVVRVFLFFTQNFKVLQFPQPFWLSSQPLKSNIRGAYRRAFSRVIRRRQGPGSLINILFLALCRHLGLHGRLVLSIPSSNVKKSSQVDDSSSRTKVPSYNENKYLYTPLPSDIAKDFEMTLQSYPGQQKKGEEIDEILRHQRKKRATQHATSHRIKTQDIMCSNQQTWILGPKIWVEIFWLKEKRWISLNPSENKFDFSEHFAGRSIKRHGVPKTIVCESSHTQLTMIPFNQSYYRNSPHSLIQSWHRDDFPWLGNEDVPFDNNPMERNNQTMRVFSTNVNPIDETIVKNKKESFRDIFFFNAKDLSSSSESDTEACDLNTTIPSNVNSVTIIHYKCYTETSVKNDNNSSMYYLELKENDYPISPKTHYDEEIDRLVLAYTFSTSLQTTNACLTPVVDSVHETSLNESNSLPPLLLSLHTPISRSHLKRQKTEEIKELLPEIDSTTLFIIASNYCGYIRDVTRRYFPQWSEIIKKRGDLHPLSSQLLTDWNELLTAEIKTLNKLKLIKRGIAMDRLDEFALEECANLEPLPTVKSKFLKHPRYVLESLLPITQIIAPREPIMGYYHGEPVFLRRNVQKLLSKVQWEEFEDRCVITGQEPLRRKLRTHRFKKNLEATQDIQYIELFGIWQTEEKPQHTLTNRMFERPIPCSQYGTVNLIGKRVIPANCIHLKHMPGVTYIVRQLEDIPWRPALIGFEYQLHKAPKPVIDGIVIWESDKDKVIHAYNGYRKRKLSYLFLKYQMTIRNLWRVLLKTLLGRYYLTTMNDYYRQDNLLLQTIPENKKVKDSLNPLQQDILLTPSNNNDTIDWEDIC